MGCQELAEPQSTTANDSRHYEKKQTKKKSAERIGVGAAAGAAVGAIAGHGKGAAIGAVPAVAQVRCTTTTKRIRPSRKTNIAPVKRIPKVANTLERAI
jgi:hypothetical protein